MADEEKVEGQEPESEEQKKDKVTKKHAEAMKFVTALVGAEKLLPRKTMKGNTTAKVVALLFSKEQEEFEAKALTDLSALLKKYFEFTAEVNKKKKELEQLELQKKKEFTEAVNNFKKSVDQQDVMNEGYALALKEATEALNKK